MKYNLQISQIDTSNLVEKNEVVAQTIWVMKEWLQVGNTDRQSTVFGLRDTEFNGKVTANRYIIVEGNGKRTIIGAELLNIRNGRPNSYWATVAVNICIYKNGGTLQYCYRLKRLMGSVGTVLMYSVIYVPIINKSYDRNLV